MSQRAVCSITTYTDEQDALPSYYSSRLFGSAAPNDKTIKMVLTEAGSSTNKVIRLRPAFHSETSVSDKIDSLAIRGLISKISKFAELEENWDGYGGVIPNGSVIIDAIELVKKFPSNLLPDRVGISGDGEISLIFERAGLFADFGVSGDDDFCYFIQCNNKKLYGDEIRLSEGISFEVLSILRK